MDQHLSLRAPEQLPAPRQPDSERPSHLLVFNSRKADVLCPSPRVADDRAWALFHVFYDRAVR